MDMMDFNHIHIYIMDFNHISWILIIYIHDTWYTIKMINIPDSAVVSAWRCPGAPSPSAWRCWKQKGCQVLIEKMERTQRCGILWVGYVGYPPKLGWCFPQEKMVCLGWFGCILYYYYYDILYYVTFFWYHIVILY